MLGAKRATVSHESQYSRVMYTLLRHLSTQRDFVNMFQQKAVHAKLHLQRTM